MCAERGATSLDMIVRTHEDNGSVCEHTVAARESYDECYIEAVEASFPREPCVRPSLSLSLSPSLACESGMRRSPSLSLSHSRPPPPRTVRATGALTPSLSLTLAFPPPRTTPTPVGLVRRYEPKDTQEYRSGEIDDIIAAAGEPLPSDVVVHVCAHVRSRKGAWYEAEAVRLIVAHHADTDGAEVFGADGVLPWNGHKLCVYFLVPRRG